MSRIIKAAQWADRPEVIEAPEPPPPPPPDPVEEEDDTEERQKQLAAAESRLKKRLAEAEATERHASDVLAKAKRESAAMMQHAKNERDRILEEANETAEQIKLRTETKAREEGHAEGYAAGETEGKKKAEDDMAAAIQGANEKAEKTLKDAKDATRYYLEKAENDVTAIAMSIVEKILPQHFIDVPQVILPLVEKALEQVKDQQEITVRVAPDVYDLVLMARDELRSKLDSATADLSVTSDETLKPGDCVIETPNGDVDARLKTQLELIKQTIQDMKM